jgi:hypothetical protein
VGRFVAIAIALTDGQPHDQADGKPDADSDRIADGETHRDADDYSESHGLANRNAQERL